MRRTLREVRENLEEFVQQEDHSLLLVGGKDNDFPYFLKIQEQLEGEDPGSIYFAFADDFIDEQNYSLAIARRLADLLVLGNQERANEKRAELAAFPSTMFAAETPCRERLIIALKHMKQWLPNLNEYRIVITLIPLHAPPGNNYLKFISQFAQFEKPESWMKYGRIIVRDDRATHSNALALANRKARRILAFDIDFSIEALAADMSLEAVDPSAPLADRMQACLQLAMIDMSYKRFEEAINKYALLYEYYQQIDAPLMQAMCLLGVGDCMRMEGKIAEAKQRYQQGLAIAINARAPYPVQAPPLADNSTSPSEGMHPSAPPILLNLLLAAGESSMTLSQYEDARSYFESASKVSAKCMNPYAAADALERQGQAEFHLQLYPQTISSWNDSEKIAEACNHYDRLESVLQHKYELYTSARMQLEASEMQKKLTIIRQKRAQQPL